MWHICKHVISKLQSKLSDCSFLNIVYNRNFLAVGFISAVGMARTKSIEINPFEIVADFQCLRNKLLPIMQKKFIILTLHTFAEKGISHFQQKTLLFWLQCCSTFFLKLCFFTSDF